MFIDENGEKWFKVGLHIHTKRSDGRKTPEEVAAIYKAAGFDAVAFTDHWVYGAPQEIGGLPILGGIECNLGDQDTAVDVMHIIGVGLEKAPACTKESSTRQDVIDAIHAAGGLAILAHPMWSLNAPEEALALKGLDGVEIYNTVSDVNQSFRPYSGYFTDLLANRGMLLPLYATDDAHYYKGEDEARSFVMVHAENAGREALLAALRAGDFYASQGPRVRLEVRDGEVYCYCSPADKVVISTNAAWHNNRVTRTPGTIFVHYTPKDCDRWARAEIYRDGKVAWSNFVRIK